MASTIRLLTPRLSSDRLQRNQRDTFDPQKRDPEMPSMAPKRSLDIFEKYQSQMDANPFESASFRDTQAAKESHFPPMDYHQMYADNDKLAPCQVYVVRSDRDLSNVHPAFRHGSSVDERGSPIAKINAQREDIPPPLFDRHKRSVSESQSPTKDPQHAAAAFPLRRTIPVSASDNNFFGGRYSASRLPSSLQLETIEENEDVTQNYKVAVSSEGDAEVKLVRSPLKKLFGENGLLGRSTNPREAPDPRYKKPWAGKMKKRVEEISKDFTEKLSTVSLPTARRGDDIKGPSTFPISLSPYVQGDLYMELELLLQIETNRFIKYEFQNDRISMASVKKVVEIWRNKGRPQVLGFRYDLATQRDLIVLNVDTISFAGVNSCSRIRLFSVLTAWKMLAKEMSIRTYCQPDSAVKKHLADAERVLELIDVEHDSMLAFQDLKARILSEIEGQQKIEKQKSSRVHGREIAWSPRRYENKTH